MGVKYKEVAVPLVTLVCQRAIDQAKIPLSDIGKLVVVSSTGFLGPSLDCALIENLGLSRGTDRSLIGFMGCAAAMNGYRIALDYVTAHPGKLALMVCVEISSVHSTFKNATNDAILHAIFADGAAACVLAAKKPSEVPVGTLAIVDEHGHLMDGTKDGITLAINDDGISCTLSKYLPQYIAKNMGGIRGCVPRQAQHQAIQLLGARLLLGHSSGGTKNHRGGTEWAWTQGVPRC